MRNFIYILLLTSSIACSTKTTLNENIIGKFCNDIITDSIINQIPTITNTMFFINTASIPTIDKDYSRVDQKQFDFFLTKEDQTKLFDYYGKFNVYYLGKKRLENEKLGIFLLCDASYMGTWLYCAILDIEGKIVGKFEPAYYEQDAGYLIKGQGEFLNDSTYKYFEESHVYIDNDHKKQKRDSLIRVIIVGKNSIQTQQEIVFPTDTIDIEASVKK